MNDKNLLTTVIPYKSDDNMSSGLKIEIPININVKIIEYSV
jgi:hypothetical protein